MAAMEERTIISMRVPHVLHVCQWIAGERGFGVLSVTPSEEVAIRVLCRTVGFYEGNGYSAHGDIRVGEVMLYHPPSKPHLKDINLWIERLPEP